MALKDETLEALFEQWKTILETSPSEDERAHLAALQHYKLPMPLSQWDDLNYFNEWLAELPAYYRDKADVMLEILTRLKAREPFQWVRSEIREDIPQLAYFLFARHLELFVFDDPLRLKELVDLQIEPEWLADLLQKGMTLEEIDALARQVAWQTLGNLFALTDGSGRYGDLPRNAPRPRLVEAEIEGDKRPRALRAVHELMEDSVLQAAPPEAGAARNLSAE